jgi:hypothetical protein
VADPDIAVDVSRLSPPDPWHTDQVDEDDRESVDYKLTALGAASTRLDLLVTERRFTADHLSREETAGRVRAAWGRYARSIELRYRGGRPAKGPA